MLYYGNGAVVSFPFTIHLEQRNLLRILIEAIFNIFC